jgi:hypothetical protein
MTYYSNNEQRRTDRARSFLNGLGCFLLGLAVAIAASSSAQNWKIEPASQDRALEIGVGVCQYGIYNAGSWWDVGYETKNSLTPACGSIGLRKMFMQLGPNWKLGARFAYNDLGTVKTNNVTSVLQDGSVERGEPCDLNTFRGCQGRWQGEGSAKGISAGFVLEDGALCAGPFGCGWVPQLEAGALFYRGKWIVNGSIEGASNSGDLLNNLSPGQWEKTSEGGARWSRAKGTTTSGYIGMGVRKEAFFVNVRVYNFIIARSNRPQEHSLFGNAAWQVLAGVSLPL